MGEPGVMRERVLKSFRELGAIGPANAKSAVELGINNIHLERALNHFVENGWIVQEGDNYYLEEKYKDSLLKRLFDSI